MTQNRTSVGGRGSHVCTLILPAAAELTLILGAPPIAFPSLTESERSYADPSTNIRNALRLTVQRIRRRLRAWD
jgi:hypothetical protein